MSGLDLSNCRRLVIKVGSSLLVDDSGELNRTWLESLADDVARLVSNDREVLIVSSGAIAIGSSILRIDKRRARLDDLQAAAAAGQVQLVHAYQEAFRRQQLSAAQVLLTPEDTEHRRRFLNARNTLAKLLDKSVIPIINENDTVATEEIRYGDNDRLAARIAQMVMADALILLSDIDGLYTADPLKDKSASHIPLVKIINDDVLAMAGESLSDVGTGGMATKVQAAEIALRAGCSTVVANGVPAHSIRSLLDGARCTVFQASASPAAARKQWLAGVLDVAGDLRLDDGAVAAVRGGGSLLPVGVTAAGGEFRRGDVVLLVDSNGNEIGRGLAEYNVDEARCITGLRSEHIESELGYRGRAVMVHRDELVLYDIE